MSACLAASQGLEMMVPARVNARHLITGLWEPTMAEQLSLPLASVKRRPGRPKGGEPWNKGNLCLYHWVCEWCGVAFSTRVKDPRRFCSRKCNHAHRRTGDFEIRGEKHKAYAIGDERIFTSNGERKPRAWVKIQHGLGRQNWKPRAVLVWEKLNGPVPDSYVVHHENRDTLDDRPANLRLQTRAEHMDEHRHDLELAKRMKRHWHAPQMQEVDRPRCVLCGKQFTPVRLRAQIYCSKSCVQKVSRRKTAA